MSTRQQIRNQVRVLINETDSENSHFTDSELNEFIDQSQTYLSTFIEYPRDFFEVESEEGVPVYVLPKDNIKLLTIYFGDVNTANDVIPLKVINERTLKEMFRNWLDETESSKGKPRFIMQLNRREILIHPRPDSDEAGKKIMVNYVYQPASLSAEGSEPDLPRPFHDVLQFYVAHLAYIKLQDLPRSATMLSMFDKKVNELKAVLEKEIEESFSFQWGTQEELNDFTNRIIL